MCNIKRINKLNCDVWDNVISQILNNQHGLENVKIKSDVFILGSSVRSFLNVCGYV
jgi:hypothetical protein